AGAHRAAPGHRTRRARRAGSARGHASGHPPASRTGPGRHRPGHHRQQPPGRRPMIGTNFDYLRPASVSEALDMASRHEDARFLAGGHALLPEWKLGRTRPPTLIDLGRIAELRGIEVLGGGPSPAAGAGITVRI